MGCVRVAPDQRAGDVLQAGGSGGSDRPAPWVGNIQPECVHRRGISRGRVLRPGHGSAGLRVEPGAACGMGDWGLRRARRATDGRIGDRAGKPRRSFLRGADRHRHVGQPSGQSLAARAGGQRRDPTATASGLLCPRGSLQAGEMVLLPPRLEEDRPAHDLERGQSVRVERLPCGGADASHVREGCQRRPDAPPSKDRGADAPPLGRSGPGGAAKRHGDHGCEDPGSALGRVRRDPCTRSS